MLAGKPFVAVFCVLVLASFGLPSGSAAAQAPPLLWQTAFDSWPELGGGGYDVMNDVLPTADGGAVAAGYAVPANPAMPQRAFVVRLDAAGAQMWRAYLGDGADAYAAVRVRPAADGFLVACTAFTPFGEGAAGIYYNTSFVARLDASGVEQWRYRFDPLALDQVGDIDVLPDGSILAAGRAWDEFGGTYTALAKLSAAGALIWQRKEAPVYILSVYKAAATPDGGLFAVAGDGLSVFVARYSADGTPLWQASAGGLEGNGLYSEKTVSGITVSADGGCSVVGAARTVNWNGSYGPFCPYTASFDAFGAQTAALVVPTTSVWVHTVERVSDGGFLAAEGVNSSNNGAVFVRYDAAGSELWRASYGPPSDAPDGYIMAIRETPDGRLFAAGAVRGTAQATLDGYVLALGDAVPGGHSQDVVARIDVLPGNPKNVVNYRAQGELPVALLSSAGFDAPSVDLSTVTLEGVPPSTDGRRRVRAVVKDVDRDGLKDVLLFFSVRPMGLSSGSNKVTMEGAAPGGGRFRGSDTVRVVGPKNR